MTRARVTMKTRRRRKLPKRKPKPKPKPKPKRKVVTMATRRRRKARLPRGFKKYVVPYRRVGEFIDYGREHIEMYAEAVRPFLVHPNLTAHTTTKLMHAAYMCGDELLHRLNQVQRRGLDTLDYAASAIIALKNVGHYDLVFPNLSVSGITALERFWRFRRHSLKKRESEIIKKVGWIVCPRFEGIVS